MTKPDRNRSAHASKKSPPLDDLSEGDFVKGWTAIVGEPPAIMLDSRADMVRVLVDSVPVATSTPADAPTDDQTDIAMPEPQGATGPAGSR